MDAVLEQMQRTLTQLQEQLSDLRERRQHELAAGRALSDREWMVIKMAKAAQSGWYISGEELRQKLLEQHPDAAY